MITEIIRNIAELKDGQTLTITIYKKTVYDKEREKTLNHRRRQEAYKAFTDELGWSGSKNIFRAFERVKEVNNRFDELTKRA